MLQLIPVQNQNKYMHAIPMTKAYYMNARKNIIRMILMALGVIAIICILLSLSGCSGGADNSSFNIFSYT
jgi:hypothetical protein